MQQERQPVCDIGQSGVAIAVLIDEPAPLDVEADMVETVSDCIDPLLAKDEGATTVRLDQMKTGLNTVFVVAMQGRPFHRPMILDPGVEIMQVDLVDIAIVGDAGGPDPLYEDLVHAIGSCGPLTDLTSGNSIIEAEIVTDQLNDMIKARAGRSMDLAID